MPPLLHRAAIKTYKFMLESHVEWTNVSELYNM